MTHDPPHEVHEDNYGAPPERDDPPHGDEHHPHRNGAAGDPLAARTPLGFRQQPHNLDAEQAVLGAILVNNDAYRRVAGFLQPEHFYEPVHGRIYAAMARLIGLGRIADHVTMAEQFDQDPDLQELDGRDYLSRMARAAVTVVSAEDYGQVIFEDAVRRAVIHVGQEAVDKAFDPTVQETALEQLGKLRADLEKLDDSTVGKAQPLVYVSNADLDEHLPDRRFIIGHWIPEGCLSSLYGSGGTGKSFLAMMMAMSIATGRDWLGFPCQETSVLALMCEDDEDEIKRRRNRIARSMGLSAFDVTDRLWLASRYGESNHLMQFPGGVAEKTPLYHRVVNEAIRTGSRLVILDNAGQMFAGNENDRSQVTTFLNACAGIAKDVDGSVLILGHPPKAAGVDFSGSTAWNNVTRSRLWFKRLEDEEGAPEGPQRYSLELVKSNYAKPFGVELRENDQGVVEYVGELTKAKQGRPSAADRVLRALQSLFETHRRAIGEDEILDECLRIGVYVPSDKPATRRKQLQRVREALAGKRHEIDDRGDGFYAIRP